MVYFQLLVLLIHHRNVKFFLIHDYKCPIRKNGMTNETGGSSQIISIPKTLNAHTLIISK